MYRTMQIEVTDDIADKILLDELQSQYENLIDDFLLRKQGKGIAVFHADANTDTMLLKAHCDAFELVLQYNMTPDEYKAYHTSVALNKLVELAEQGDA